MPATRATGGAPGCVVFRITMVTLAVLLTWSAAHAGLPQFRDKAMPIRLACSPVAALVVPGAWWALGRRAARRLPFPYLPASLVALTLVIDLAGNAMRLYAEVEDFDDAVHVVNPMLLVAALTLLLADCEVPRWTVWVMAFGVGCAGNLVWELLEYALMQGVGAVGLHLSLRDTLSDQAWGVLGAAVGATIPLLRPSLAHDEAFVPRPAQTAHRAGASVADAGIHLVSTAPEAP